MKLAILLLNLVLTLTIGVLVMIHGWGITPKDWTVIIGGYVALAIVSALASLVKP